MDLSLIFYIVISGIFQTVCQFSSIIRFPPPHGSAAQVALGLLITEVFRSHSHTQHSVGLLWTSNRPISGTSTWRHTQPSQDTDTFMPSAGFRLTVAANEQPQTHTLDHMTTGIVQIIHFLHCKQEID